MTVKELKQIIADIPDDMIVGGSGYMGEFLDVDRIGVESVFEDTLSDKRMTILRIDLDESFDPER